MFRIVLLNPNLTSQCQFQQFSSGGKLFHFQNENFAKIWSERFLRIKTKSHQVWAS